jgi:hypothetical protein
MENRKKPAFPLGQAENFNWSDGVDLGLTKREYFAGLAMQAMVSRDNASSGFSEDMAEQCVLIADELLKQLGE